MLPPGKKSLYEIYVLYDPADRLTNAATLLEYCLAQLAPNLRRADGSAPNLSDRLRHSAGQLPEARRLQPAVQARNRLVHAQGQPVTPGELAAATQVLLEALMGLLPSLPPALAQAVRGGPPAAAAEQAPAVNFRGLIFAHHKRDAGAQWGMQLLVTFMALGLRGRSAVLLVSFFDRSGSPLLDQDRNYATGRGEAAVWARFTPHSDREDFFLFPLFMPYAQLHVPPGHHIVRCRAAAYLLVGEQQSSLLAESDDEMFSVVRTGDDYTGGVA